MCALQTGKGRSILRCVRLLFAVAAAACLSHSAMAQVREPATLPPGFPADDDHVYISESALREDLVFCRQSAGQSVAEAPGVPQPTQSASAFDPQTDATQLDHRDRIFYPGDTERLKPLGRKLLLNILLDQKEIFTSPFRMNRHNAKWWLLSAAVTGGLIAADRHIADSFENSNGQVRWGGRISNIGASYTLIPIVAGSYAYGVWRDNAKAREIGVLGTETLLDGLIVAGILKEVTRRNRPDEKDPGDFWGGGTS